MKKRSATRIISVFVLIFAPDNDIHKINETEFKKLLCITAMSRSDNNHRIALAGKLTCLSLSLLRGIADSINHTIVLIIP